MPADIIRYQFRVHVGVPGKHMKPDAIAKGGENSGIAEVKGKGRG